MRRRVLSFAPPRQLNRYVSMSWLRTIAAFVIAPLITPIVICLYLFSGQALSVRQVVGCFYLFGPFAYIAAIIFGLPIFVLFRWLNWTNVGLFFIFGTLIGLGVGMIMARHNPIEYILARHLGELAVCGISGGLSALAFRFIAFGFGRVNYRVPMRRET
jgi:hypothetical protein